jgi:hypothetical protein
VAKKLTEKKAKPAAKETAFKKVAQQRKQKKIRCSKETCGRQKTSSEKSKEVNRFDHTIQFTCKTLGSCAKKKQLKCPYQDNKQSSYII